MSATASEPEDIHPEIRFTAPTFRINSPQGESSSTRSTPKNGNQGIQNTTRKRQRSSKHIEILETDSRRSSKVILGSYGKSPPHSRRQSFQDSLNPDVTRSGSIVTPRSSISHEQLGRLLEAVDYEPDTYGLEEHRDGFFDASFYRPPERDHEKLRLKALETLPESFLRHRSLSLDVETLWSQWRGIVVFLTEIFTTRAGIRLAKSFIGFFVAYVLCLIPVTRTWLGRYNYILALSVIINHPGRPVGSQLDGAFLTIIGTAAGLGWGSLALYVSTSTVPAKNGFGGILATFLVLFTLTIGWLRCVFIRFYQAIISAGFAICYTCLANTSEAVGWNKIFDYGIPWVLGQAIALIVSATVFPAAGSRPLAISLHSSLQILQKALTLPHPDTTFLKRDLAWHFVNLSQAVRDFTIDLSICPIYPDDARSLRNLVQGVIRGVLAIPPDTTLFEGLDDTSDDSIHEGDAIISRGSSPRDRPSRAGTSSTSALLMCKMLRLPTRKLINDLKDSIDVADAALMDISKERKYLGPPRNTPCDVSEVLDRVRKAMALFDEADVSLTNHPNLPHTYAHQPEMVEIFLFVHPVRQVADKIVLLLQRVLEMQQKTRGWRVHLPSYPWSKSIMRINAQVRHDRGGLTAGFYFRNKSQLERTMEDLQSTGYVPRPPTLQAESEKSENDGKQNQPSWKSPNGKPEVLQEDKDCTKRAKFRYRVWLVLHHLQGFESRFAFKITLATTLLSIPAWLPQSRSWWNLNESWWSVVMIWIMMHPRVGGTIQDLVTRVSCAVFGSVWAGLAYAAGQGNPYVMAVFAVLFMIPMLYRYSLSVHPRSGIVGCMSFTIVSLIAYDDENTAEVIHTAWTRGIAFVVGVVVAVSVNWGLWPFVARHELRKSVSTMILHMAILYRSVVAKYVYYNKGEEPSLDDISKSEMLEGRLREGFVRIRQLMELTRHEIRLRAPFDPLLYSALITSCEAFFEHLVQVRLSSLYFHTDSMRDSDENSQSLIAARRDAVAAILVNLYVLAGALRADRPVPRYLPSAARARKHLLDLMDQAKSEMEGDEETYKLDKGRRWADVYQYAFSAALTDIVGQLQQLQRYTKEITGEFGFAPLD